MSAMQLDAIDHANCPATTGGECSLPDRIDAIRVHYRARNVPPMTLARIVHRAFDDTELTAWAIAKQAGMTPGSIHHYRSLLSDLAPALQEALAAKKLSFKEARALADIRPENRQLVASEPFVHGWLGGMHVERFVTLFKRAGNIDPRAALAKAQAGMKASTTKRGQIALATGRPTPRAKPRIIAAQARDLAANLDIYLLVPPSEVERMAVVSALRLLQSRVDKALGPLRAPQAHANGANGTYPRPAQKPGLSANGLRAYAGAER